VGDSLGQVELGLERTAEVSMGMILHHLGAVRRGVQQTHLLADMPYGSYTDRETALENAFRLTEAGADSVKLEGPEYEVVAHLVANGVDVMGHVGLLPQTASRFVRQGTKSSSAQRIQRETSGLDEAGCYAVVLEFIPAELAERITGSVAVPTIGIGAGPRCDGQVLVVSDLLGLYPDVPSFARKYAHLREEIIGAGEAFVSDVRAGRFPTESADPA
jgi:3-methyl-2-oxobutanoate hydroxymethyltransferase